MSTQTQRHGWWQDADMEIGKWKKCGAKVIMKPSKTKSGYSELPVHLGVVYIYIYTYIYTVPQNTLTNFGLIPLSSLCLIIPPECLDIFLLTFVYICNDLS
jgi:hypothetical protein